MTAIADIVVRQRFRREAGDLAGLMKSIETLGLLQPIVITPDRQLIAGARRLFACRQLGWPDIPTREVDIEAIVLGEHDENICRKDFTKSERVAIAAALHDFKNGGDRRSDQSVARHSESAEAIEKAGFDSKREFYRAKKVVDKGDPDLIAAMDAGKISTEKAAKAAKLPAAEQKKIAALPTPKEARKIARKQGGLVRANNGKLIDGRTKAEAKANQERTKVEFQLILAIEALAKMAEAPAEYIASLPAYLADDIDRHLDLATHWLNDFSRLWKERKAQS